MASKLSELVKQATLATKLDHAYRQPSCCAWAPVSYLQIICKILINVPSKRRLNANFDDKFNLFAKIYNISRKIFFVKLVASEDRLRRADEEAGSVAERPNVGEPFC